MRNKADFKINLVSKYLRPLIDDYFDDESLLARINLNSFTPPLRFEEHFCETPEELKEQRCFTKSRNKDQVFPNEGSLRTFIKLRESREASRRITGDIWDSELTLFKRRVLQMRTLDPKGFFRIQAPYKREMVELWEEEISTFSHNLYKEFDEDKKNSSRRNLYKLVMEDRVLEFGFEFDKCLSTSTKPVFSKPMMEPWKLCFFLDNSMLNKPVSGQIKNIDTGEISRIGPMLYMSFGLVHISNRGIKLDDKNKIKAFNFSWYFPLEWNCYNSFYTLQELEALVNIHISMYEILQNDFERALLKGLQEYLV